MNHMWEKKRPIGGEQQEAVKYAIYRYGHRLHSYYLKCPSPETAWKLTILSNL